MGETRASFRRTSNLIMLFFSVIAIVAFLLMPFTNPWLAATVVGAAVFVILIALFLRFVF